MTPTPGSGVRSNAARAATQARDSGSSIDSSQSGSKLGHGLRQRHVVMLSIGGSIGAGLFVGSGHAIAEAGPAAILAYVFASILVVLVMRMLGEMACAMPDSGSFSTYASKAITLRPIYSVWRSMTDLGRRAFPSYLPAVTDFTSSLSAVTICFNACFCSSSSGCNGVRNPPVRSPANSHPCLID